MFDCNELSLQRRASRQRLQCIGSFIVEIVNEPHPSPIDLDIVALDFGHKEREGGLFYDVLPLKLHGIDQSATREAVKAPDQTDGMVIQVLAHFEIRINEFLQ